MRFPISPFLLATWIALAGACSSNDPEPKALSEGCSINSDCSSPLVCAFTKCHNACNTTRDCSPGQRCVASDRPFHVCQLDTEKGCSFNSDCPVGQTCGVDLQCRDQCAADRDCVKEQTCAGGTCAEPSELTDGKLPVVSRDGGSDASSGHPCLYTSECPNPLICLDRTCAVECREPRDCKGSDCVGNRCVGAPGNLIGPEGGIVSVGGGKIQLTVPSGALRNKVRISILPLDAWPDGALGQVYEIIPSGLGFEVPATLTYQFAPSEIGTVQPADLRLANAVGATWSPLTTTLDPVHSVLTASLAHLSVYGVVGPLIAPDASVAPRDGGVEASPVADAGSPAADAAAMLDATTVPDAGVVVPPFDCSGNIVFGDPALKALMQYQFDTSGEITGTDALLLTSISIADSMFSSFDGIQCFSNLKTMNMTSTQVTDLSALASLTNLTSLDLNGDQITDFSPLAGLVNLTTLNLQGNDANDANIVALGNLKKLSTLYIDGNITDVSPLAALPVLANLTLTGGSMTDLTSVGKLTALTRLILSEQPSTSIAPLANLTKLTDLTLFTDATDISPLAALPKLVRLDVEDSGTSNLSSFATFASAGTLTTLVLRNDGISDLTGLGQLLALTDLELSNNQISNLTPIAGLPNMYYLNLESNQITDLTPIANNPFGDGSTMIVRSNPLNCTSQASNLAALLSAGVDTQTDCP